MAGGQIARTRWGGTADGLFSSNGYFRVCKNGNSYWFVDPDGGSFLSKGINNVRFDADRIRNTNCFPYAVACQTKYGNIANWRAATAARLVQWGFNTLGSWSDEAVAHAGERQLAIAPNLDLGMSFLWRKSEAANAKGMQAFPDVFDPAFKHHVQDRARTLCGPRREDSNVIGWFVDNELRWGPDWRGSDELLTLFLALPPESYGRRAALGWLQQRYLEFDAFNKSWGTSAASWNEAQQLPQIAQPYLRAPSYNRDAGYEAAANRRDPSRAAFASDCDEFAAFVAEHYCASTTSAIKAADPNHLVLGYRFAYPPAVHAIEIAGRHADVLSFNCYEFSPTTAIETYKIGEKPCLITEFSFRAADSGLPNTLGAGPRVSTQADRATCFREYVNAAVQQSVVVGYHWFEHADQPAEGRFDGENSNFGIVSIDDHVYIELAKAITTVNGTVEQRHGSAFAIS